MAVVTNDIFTREDAEFLVRNDALEHGNTLFGIGTMYKVASTTLFPTPI